MASASTDSYGSFELVLPNGIYSITGRSTLHQGGESNCKAASDVDVKDRYVEGVIVDCIE